MILMRILPGVLKELSKHVPTILFQAVEWSVLAQELPKISRRIIQKEGYEDLVRERQRELGAYHIVLSQDLPEHRSLKGQKWSGEQILTLYFVQLYSRHGVFLDLRPQHFFFRGDELIWHPTTFWTALDETFRQGLIQVYEGFYLEQEALYYEGLKAIGLIQADWSEEDKHQLASLFRQQFGESINEEQSFDLDHFQASIVKLSEFMLNKKVKIPKDFLYVGIYLVGLYSSLEEVGVKLPVKEIFLKVREASSQK